jgi:hypothetical protein
LIKRRKFCHYPAWKGENINPNLNLTSYRAFTEEECSRNFYLLQETHGAINDNNIYDLHIYHSRIIPNMVAETSQIIILRDIFYQNDLATRNTADMTGDKPLAV